ncbi:hypothetical protein BDZ45DRAFT_805448 [Acephala macrosclerotiorum]|nr:hypothetical protein BDZ45DRAFT_805448 [Acephala macrosclerotiorum]
MTNITEPQLLPLHGTSITHIPRQTPYYLPNYLPTPWPLLVTGVLVSLVISCYGVKPAFLSLNTTNSSSERPKSPWTRRKNTHRLHAHETELERLHVPKVDDLPPPYRSHRTSNNLDTSYEREIAESNTEFDHPPSPASRLPTWTEIASPIKRFIDVFLIGYSSFRAIVAIIIALGALISTHISPPAPSNLLLLLVSVQILLANLPYPRVLQGLLTVDVLLAALAFTITSYSSFSSSHAKYGQLSFTDGTCPIVASNCIQQSTHWSSVGRGNYTKLIDYEDDELDGLFCGGGAEGWQWMVGVEGVK